MVGRGEILERMTTVPTPNGPLEALWQGGGIGVAHRRPVLLCPPHPRLGGSMDSAILAELVWQLARRRHQTLRFNFAGVSASQGTMALPWLPTTEPVDLEPLVEDARAALRHLVATTGAKDVGIVGVSVGAIVAARLFLEEDCVAACALVSPLVRGVLGPGDALDAAALKATGSPVVVVVGDADTHARAADVIAVCEGLRVVVVAGADHGFVRGLSACASAVTSTLGSGSTGDDLDDDADEDRWLK